MLLPAVALLPQSTVVVNKGRINENGEVCISFQGLLFQIQSLFQKLNIFSDSFC